MCSSYIASLISGHRTARDKGRSAHFKSSQSKFQSVQHSGKFVGTLPGAGDFSVPLASGVTFSLQLVQFYRSQVVQIYEHGEHPRLRLSSISPRLSDRQLRRTERSAPKKVDRAGPAQRCSPHLEGHLWTQHYINPVRETKQTRQLSGDARSLSPVLKEWCIEAFLICFFLAAVRPWGSLPSAFGRRMFSGLAFAAAFDSDLALLAAQETWKRKELNLPE